MVPESNETKLANEFDKLIELSDKMTKNEEGLNEEEVNEMAKLLDNVNLKEEMPRFDNLSDEEKEKLIDEGNKPVLVNQTVDPVTGVRTITPIAPVAEPEKKKEKYEELLDYNDDEIREKVDVKIENVRSTLQNNFTDVNLTDEDIEVFIDVLERYRKGEKFSYYNAMSDGFKSNMDMILTASGYDVYMKKEVRNTVIKEIFEMVIHDNYMDTVFTDLNDSITSELNKINDELITPELSKERVETRKQIVEFLELADKIQEENPEQAEKLRIFHENFTQAYTYENMMEAYKTKRGKYKAKKIEIEKFNRTCDEFCFRYKESTQKVFDVAMLYPILCRKLPDISEESIKKFIIVFIKYTMNMDITKIESDYTFIFYFMKHILNLDHIDANNQEDVEFCDNVLKNIRTFISLIEAQQSINK